MAAIKKNLSPVTMTGNQIENVKRPVSGNDAVNLDYVNEVTRAEDFQDSVQCVQKDELLDPILTLGIRYIITNPSHLNVNFGAISGLGVNDIVIYTMDGWKVDYDISVLVPDFLLTWSEDDEVFYQYLVVDNVGSWMIAQISDQAVGEGLVKNSAEIKIDISRVARKVVAIIGNGTNSVFTVTHDLNSKSLWVAIKEVATDAPVEASVEFLDNTHIQITFSLVPPVGAYELLIIG